MTCYLHFENGKFIFHTHDEKLINTAYLVISTIKCLEPEIHLYEIVDNLIVEKNSYQTYEKIEESDEINLMKAKISLLEFNLENLKKRFDELTVC